MQLHAAAAAGHNLGRVSQASNAGALLADWIARSTATGVTFASDFSGPNDFVLASTNGGHVFATGMNAPDLALVVKDLTDGITNGCCLRFDKPAATTKGATDWMFPLNSAWTDNTQSFGVGSEFWIQFRFKIPASRLVLADCGGNQRGWKWFNLAAYSPTNTVAQSPSNIPCEIVLQDSDQSGMPQAYHQDGVSFPTFSGTSPDDGEPLLQPAIDRGASFFGPNRYCEYPAGGGGTACFFWPVEEWMTFDMRVKVGTFGGSTGNEFDLWVARRGDTSRLQLIAARGFTLGIPDSGSGFGFTGYNGGHLLNYETNRLSDSVDTQVKYDQVIVSTQAIALPVG